MDQDWVNEKRAFEEDEKEIAQGRQTILSQIEDTKESQKKLELKVKDLERRIRLEQNDVEDLEIDIKIKKKELIDQKQSKLKTANAEIHDLESELRNKE